MEIDEDALKAFEASKFNFVDDKIKPVAKPFIFG